VGGYIQVGHWYRTTDQVGSVIINVPVTMCSTDGTTLSVNPNTQFVLYGTDITGSTGVGQGADQLQNNNGIPVPMTASPDSCAYARVTFSYWDFGTNGQPKYFELVDALGNPHATWTLSQ
jgi:hypothetical protein